MAFEKVFFETFSEFTFKFESEFDSREQKLHIRKITEINMQYVSPKQEAKSLYSLKELLSNYSIFPIEETYSGFKIIRFGNNDMVKITNETDLKCIKDYLEKNPILAYWDYKSIAFIISDKSEYNYQLFSEFLSQSRKLIHVQHTGILIK